MAEDHYAILEDNTIVNVVVCDDPSFANGQGWVDLQGLDPKPWIGWTVTGGTWAPPEEP